MAPFFTEAEEEETGLMVKMKETVDKLREELRTCKREVTQKTSDLELVSSTLYSTSRA